ncbi:hypothetical protein [Methylobacterium nodulans]|uniref:Uncharacterized protein n=1 Tax=Methylobacterium nodulans (strain LMG 21967 / CNCM I-2342 / ORS 2060) TaxID=460265 RepID=B8IRC7_METNO|nr:hypothetical protein [Methylobacterium nodulans]ACL58667.1 hypothetical protein Mnod_3761 [Methylobacterium nodulans ORS 2060]
MSDNDAEAQRERARALRNQIAELTGKAKPGVPADAGQDAGGRRDAPRVHPSSPRDFVERRMRELDRERGGGKDK